MTMYSSSLTYPKPRLTFLRTFLQNPVGIGSITPSSRSLAREMVRGLELKSGETVLEFGPGTGSFTSQIQRIIPDPSAYLGIECEPAFVRLLSRRFPDLDFVAAPAENVKTIYEQSGLEPIRAIISGLPSTGVKSSVHDLILESIESLMTPGCIFRTFQYVHTYWLPSAVRFRKKMSRIYGRHYRSRAVLRNVPPAFVLTWTR
ncbi:MAG: hypothetical protein V1789_05760 [PVC group bacterium]